MPKAKLDPPPPQKPRRRTLSDPLAVALLPPPDESPIDREVRLKAEIDAKKVSDSIDDMIRQERIDQKKSKAAVNVLLLGQSESGKSTTLKRELLHDITQYPTGISISVRPIIKPANVLSAC
jgi:guanine nucleotide-binding protein alpha-1 subunit